MFILKAQRENKQIKITSFYLFSLLLLIGSRAYGQSNEQITVTSYYPSIFGQYDTFRLAPRNTLPSADCDAPGEEG